jgi:hypothetical protein
MTFGNPDIRPIAAQHQVALTKYAAQYRLVRTGKQRREPSWATNRDTRAPDLV